MHTMKRKIDNVPNQHSDVDIYEEIAGEMLEKIKNNPPKKFSLEIKLENLKNFIKTLYEKTKIMSVDAMEIIFKSKHKKIDKSRRADIKKSLEATEVVTTPQEGRYIYYYLSEKIKGKIDFYRQQTEDSHVIKEKESVKKRKLNPSDNVSEEPQQVDTRKNDSGNNRVESIKSEAAEVSHVPARSAPEYHSEFGQKDDLFSWWLLKQSNVKHLPLSPRLDVRPAEDQGALPEQSLGAYSSEYLSTNDGQENFGNGHLRNDNPSESQDTASVELSLVDTSEGSLYQWYEKNCNSLFFRDEAREQSFFRNSSQNSTDLPIPEQQQQMQQQN